MIAIVPAKLRPDAPIVQVNWTHGGRVIPIAAFELQIPLCECLTRGTRSRLGKIIESFPNICQSPLKLFLVFDVHGINGKIPHLP